jgi:ribosomal protein S16
MVQVRIRLQNHGKKNHPYWWIVIQPKEKCLKGRIIERVGLYIPRKTKTIDRAIVLNKHKLRYWLAVHII